MRINHRFLLVLFSFFVATHAKAQSNWVDQALEADSDVDQVEAELKKTKMPGNKVEVERPREEIKVEKFNDLVKLAPFSEVSVIQRRFMPKTNRFQLFAGLNYLTNDPWYWGFGGDLRLGYFFTEALGIEVDYRLFSTSAKQALNDLQDNHHVNTDSFVTAKSFFGADVVWSPIYGKLGQGQKKILPFDMYFAVGLGNTQTSDSQSVPTLHLGTGQVYAINKSWAFRWDFSWHRFSASVYDKQSAKTNNNSFDELFLTAGASWFFPEAGYR